MTLWFLFQTVQAWNFPDASGCKGWFTEAGRKMVFGFHHAVSAIHTESLVELACDLMCDFSVADEKINILAI